MRAMFSAVAGLRAHQVRMDVIGNNIANVSTTGFKASRATFQDVLSQTLSSGQQVGLGVALGQVGLNQNAGSLQMTGRETDLAIGGPGFFILRSGGEVEYTRAGSFDWDAEGYLVNPATGARVQGWAAAADGSFAVRDQGSLTDIRIQRGDAATARATTRAAFGANLDAGAAAGDTYTTALTVYDSLGRAQSLRIQFAKTADNTWSWGYQPPGSTGFTSGGTLGFNPDGTLAAGGTGTVTLTFPGAAPMTVALDFSRITQAYAGPAGSTVVAREVDGSPMGTLVSLTIDGSGVITGVYSNGTRRSLAQVALARFANPGALSKAGNNAFTASAASGPAAIDQPGRGDLGQIASGTLEMSNVDLSAEFTDLIMTQRGFQANTRVITAADEMLQDLVNLRR